MQPFRSINPIILAAGDSTRMGYPKALLPIGEELFLTRILKVSGRIGMAKPIIILGRSADRIERAIHDWPVEIRINPDPDRGQLSSIQIGLSAVPPESHAAMIWPVDHPAVSEDLVRRLAQLFIDKGSLISCPEYGGRRGHPAIFHRAFFAELMDVPLAEGPKKIISSRKSETSLLPTSESAVVQDIDTPADYENLTGISLKDALASKG